METLSPQPHFDESDLEKILVSKEDISRRVEELAQEISSQYQGKVVTIVCVLSGALVFTADLIRRLDFPTRLDCIRSDSYGSSTEARIAPKISNPLKTEITGKPVIVIDDILDTGVTLRSIVDHLSLAQPVSIQTCVLLDKKDRRTADIEADFTGFQIPNEFVVGYGLDYAEHYRNLECIGSLKPEFQG